MDLRVACALAWLGPIAFPASPVTAEPSRPTGPCSGSSADSQLLLAQPVSLPYGRAALHTIVEQLQATLVPISFVDARAEELEEPLVSLTAVENLEGALRQILEQAPSYRCAAIEGHLVLYPALTKYEQRVRGVNIVRLPRIQAAWKYTELLNSQVAGFEDLISQPLRGDPSAPLYAEPVTLLPDACVLDHLVQLLGSNPKVVFVVERPCMGGVCQGARLWLSELHAAARGKP